METESANQHTIFRQRCKFCGGDHWNDLCLEYDTVEIRKQLLKRQGMCFVCLKRGHRAFECLTKKTCFFCKRENYHHRSLCHLNFNNYSVPLKETKLSNIKTEDVSSRQGSLEKIKLQSKQNTAHNEQTPDEPDSLHNRTQSNVEGEYRQIQNELQQIKSDLEDSRKENTTLNDRISKLEAEKELIQTSVSQFTEITQQLTNDLILVKGKIGHYEHKNSTLPEEFSGTSSITTGNTNKLKNSEQQRIGAEYKFEDRNSNIRSPSITEKLKNLHVECQCKDEQMEDYSFLETERAQREGDTLSRYRQSAGGGIGKDPMVENSQSQMQILKSMLKGMVLRQDYKAASLDSFTNDEQIVYAWVKMLGFLMQSKSL